MVADKPPDGPDEEELDEQDIEILSSGWKPPQTPSGLREEDLFALAPTPRKPSDVPKHGSAPIVIEPEPVRPRVTRTWEHILMREEWSFCHIKLPNVYSIDQKEWQAFARENGFSISFMGYMFTIHKTATTNRSVLMYLFGQLFIAGFDIAIRFFPQGIEFRPNKP